MTHFDFLALAPSSEFIALCQTQVALLTQGLGAAWSAVYVTKGLTEDISEAKLFPIAVYPKTEADWQPDRSARLPEFLETGSSPRLLAAAGATVPLTDTFEINAPAWAGDAIIQSSQIVLPLMYQEEIMGVLVTRREDRQWNQGELAQIDKIAKTLAIARLLDQRQSEYRQQLNEQYRTRRIERDKLDNLFHQLRNPLTALRTFSKLLLKRLLLEDRNRTVAQSILRESDRLQELLQQFEKDHEPVESYLSPTPATTALPEASSSLIPETSLHLEPLHVQEVLEPLLASAEVIAQERGVELSAELPANLPALQADNRAVREVLNNLIDNAIKYTPPGGQIIVQAGRERVTTKGSWQGIAIEDTGYGIPAAEQERIFERHYRGTQANSGISGSGLGLAIAKELIEEMQGKIELISPNQLAQANSETSNLPGTTFIVWLPVAS